MGDTSTPQSRPEGDDADAGTADTADTGAGEREEIAELQDELDARSGEEGLAAEAGSGEETGISEG